MHPKGHDTDTTLATLPNGVRVLSIHVPHVDSASVAVFVKSGSAHESRALNGVSHVIEHMLFKGTATRDARRINLDAERLGAEVNAHTDKDHTAFYMHGLAEHAVSFVGMLGDIVRHASFPAHELERERQVLLHECTEDEDDPLSTAFKLFDKACFGTHPVAQSVIGTRRNIERFTRDDLVGHVQRQYSGANIVVGAAGRVDAEAVVRAAEAAFGDMAAGSPHTLPPVPYLGDIASKREAGSSQVHLVLGGAIPSLAHDDPAALVAAAVLGEGMSSPLLDRVREQRGLAYYTACSADLLECCGQFVVEASTAPEQLDELLREVLQLLAEQAASVDPQDLDRARHQLAVRRLRAHERPYRRLEDAVLELYARGAIRSRADWLASVQAVSAERVRQTFAALLAAGVSVAVAGAVPRAASERVRAVMASLGLRAG
ncbi:M16 family metallopeptidase [Rubrivivax sp. RP6-9]|uniref:M16 family metallopeptidase n=1 Tax=Rubrivivax sp. RP6-9 TaxID=3415750 RepID=UPI003CC6729E